MNLRAHSNRMTRSELGAGAAVQLMTQPAAQWGDPTPRTSLRSARSLHSTAPSPDEAIGELKSVSRDFVVSSVCARVASSECSPERPPLQS